MSDRLSLTRALESGGMDSIVAERIATEIYDAIHDGVATKADVTALEGRLDVKLGSLGTKIELVKHQLLTRLGGLMVVLAGLLFAALHTWPPK